MTLDIPGVSLWVVYVLDMVAEIGTFWKNDPLAAYLPNLKDGLYPVVRPTSAELATVR